MRERGIIFNADMVRTVLSGSKTQTRRICSEIDPSNFPACLSKRQWARVNKALPMAFGPDYFCPFGAVGDRLWVRENFFEHGHWQGGGYDPEDSYFVSDKQVLYPADGVKRPAQRTREDFWRSRPSIHMPRWASRITLEITGVRVERLQDISEEDAKAEGITPAAGGVEKGWEHRFNFRELWMGIYSADSWQANPWVWVIEFKRVEGV